MPSLRRLLLTLVAQIVLVACGDEPMLLVTVATDLVPGVEFDHIEVDVSNAFVNTGDREAPRVRSFTRAHDAFDSIPFSITLAKDGDGELTVRVVATRADEDGDASLVVERIARVRYPTNGTRVLRIVLERTCQNITTCEHDESCVHGACVHATIDRPLESVTEGRELEGLAPPPAQTTRTGHARRHVRFNSQLELATHVSFGDIDLDGHSELVQWAATGIFATQVDGYGTGLMHMYDDPELVGVIPGEFSGTGRDFPCMRRVNGSLFCVGLDPIETTFWPWFHQGNVLERDDEIVLGDFDGNGRDDMLVLPKTGTSLILSIRDDAGFDVIPYHATDAPTWFARPVRVRAADFSGDGRTDLLLAHANGTLARYDAYVEAGSIGFTQIWSLIDAVTAGEEVLVASIDTDDREDIHLHTLATGVNRFFKADVGADGKLVPIDDVVAPTTPPGVPVRWARVRKAPGVVPGRDDMVLFDDDTVRTLEATFDRVHTFDRGVEQPAPSNHEWPKPTIVDWHGLACRYQDMASTPATMGIATMGWRMGEMGLWHVAEATYGLVRLRPKTPATWFTTDLPSSNAGASPTTLVDRCIAAAGIAPTSTAPVTAFWNGSAASPRVEGRSAFVPLAGVPDGDTGAPMRFAQSIYDQLGLGRSYLAPIEAPVPQTEHHLLDGVERLLLLGEGRIPSSRIVEMTTGGADHSIDLILGAINRPETSAPLMVRAHNQDGSYFTIELRTPAAYGFVSDSGVSVHRIRTVNGRPTSVRVSPGTEGRLGPNQSFAVSDASVPSAGVSVRVSSIHASGTWADITVTVW